MKKIVLLCSGGLSTSMLVTKMEAAAKEIDYSAEINAYSLTEASSVTKGADIVLLGPQVRFQLENIKEMSTCPVEIIDMSDYGTMNGKKVLEHVKSIIGE
jgi:PTS system cellobiose-specific IIB component